jgi:DNA polymerase delta subunit 2
VVRIHVGVKLGVGGEYLITGSRVGANGYSFFTTGGQTVDDIFKYLPSTSRLGMARRTLEWRHIAPTAPDTLCKFFFLSIYYVLIGIGIYPFPDADPFIIQHRPDVYILGNQPEYETALTGGELSFVNVRI